jgi:hypothetical protein
MDGTMIEELWAKQRLHELEMAYCRGLDRRDEVLVASVFFDDARVEHGQMFSGSGAAFAQWAVNEFLPRYEITAHYVLNEWYRIDGLRAQGEIYRLTHHQERSDGKVHVTLAAGRAFNCYECRDGAWKIAYRTVARDWISESESIAAAQAGAFQLGAAAAGPADPSYSILDLFRRGGPAGE